MNARTQKLFEDGRCIQQTDVLLAMIDMLVQELDDHEARVAALEKSERRETRVELHINRGVSGEDFMRRLEAAIGKGPGDAA